jgi:6-phosphogluconolactonase
MFVYVGAYTRAPYGHGEGISVFQFDHTSGDLRLVHNLVGILSPSFLTADPEWRYIYAVNEWDNGAVTALAREAGSGALTTLNQQPTHGDAPCYISLDASGRFLLVANYAGETVTVLPIAEDGRLDPASCVVRHQGSSVNPDRQEKAHPHMIAPSPDGRFVLATDLGMDQILVYELDLETGQLVPNRRGTVFATAEPGAGPRHFAFAPHGRTLYVINELGSSLTVYDFDSNQGALASRQTVSSLPDGFSGENTCAHVVVSTDGRFVYGSNRGHDSISIWAVDSGSGEVSLAGNESTQGQSPRNFAIDPTGTWLLAANEKSDTIVTFRRDPELGTLAATDQRTETPSPVAILFCDRD